MYVRQREEGKESESVKGKGEDTQPILKNWFYNWFVYAIIILKL